MFYRSLSSLGPLPKKTDFRPEIADLKPEIADFQPERADFRPDRARGDKRNDKQKSPCVLQDFIPFGAAAKKQKLSLK